MSGKARTKPVAPARKRVTGRERTMTDNESSELLASARQALAMVRGSKLVRGRISVRQAPAEPRPRDKKDIVELRERLNFSQGMGVFSPAASSEETAASFYAALTELLPAFDRYDSQEAAQVR